MNDSTKDVDYLAIAQSHIADLYPMIVYAQPALSDLPPGAILGTWVYSLKNYCRFIINRTPELATGVMPGDVARAWVKFNYTLPIRRRKEQKRHYQLPILAVRGLWDECLYLDVRAAYRTILTAVGFNVDYSQNRYMAGEGIVLPDIMARTKWCYSLTVAFTANNRTSLSTINREGKLTTADRFNMFSNPSLYAVASEVLASFAAEIARHCYPVYFNTDGMIIFPQYEQLAYRIAQDWGFELHEDGRGEGEVHGVGSYKVGRKRTRRIVHSDRDYISQLPSKEEIKFLKKHFRHFVSRAESVIQNYPVPR